MHKLRHLLGSLRVFDAVYRARGVSLAADLLHVTPGAVSQQIKHLESSLGVVLLQKSGRDVELTSEGEYLAVQISDLFDRIEKAVETTVEKGNPRRLRLKVLPSFAIKWLVPRLTSFYALQNGIDIEIATAGRADDLHLNDTDFVVRHGMGQWTDVHFDHLFDEAFVPVCSPSMAQSVKTPQDLLKTTLLYSMLRPEGWPTWLKAAGLGGESTHRTVALANAALCLQAAADGLGVAIAQLAYVEEDLKSGRLVQPLDLIASTDYGYYLICDPRRADLEPLRTFRQWIKTLA